MKIKASKCSCGYASVPPRDICPRCRKMTKETEIDNLGRILTYTILHIPPEGFPSPLYLAIVELRHKVRIFCAAREESGLVLGQRVIIDELEGKYYCSPISIIEKVKIILKRAISRTLRKRK